MASLLNFMKHLDNAYSSKTLSKHCRGNNTSKLIIQGHHHPDSKTKQTQHKKKKIIGQ